MMTESVAYVSGRSDVLCATFFLLAMIAGRRWLRSGGVAACLMTLVAWLASMSAKETGVMFPFVLVVYDALALESTDRRRRLSPHPSAAHRHCGCTGARAPGHAGCHRESRTSAAPLGIRLAGAGRDAALLTLLLAPVGQTIFHAIDAVTAASMRAITAIALVGLTAGLAWRIRRTAWVCSFGLCWFLLLLVPGAVLTVLNQGEPMAEHRVYLASCGLFFAIGDAAGRATSWIDRLGTRLWVLPRAVIGLTLLSCLGVTDHTEPDLVESGDAMGRGGGSRAGALPSAFAAGAGA